MDRCELHASTSYHSGRTELSSLESSSHNFGNVYATGNAVVHLGDSVHSIQGGLPNDLEQRQTKANLQELKNGLYFDTMGDRRARLASVPEASIAWVWNTAFRSWLTANEPFFWITGKPGSGKSTLLNCLSSSRETDRILHADGGEWVTLDFYFDNAAGTAIANSKQGLLRSLLFHLVNKLPVMGQYIHERHSHALGGSWLEHESELISTLCDVLNFGTVKICAFIDGIDEFAGKLRDLVLTLRDIQRRTGMKICLASRPDKMLSRMFATSPSLQVQDHNAATIKNYIDSACEALTEEEIEASRPLWRLIEEEANGIILWARFVVDELVDQLVVGATLKELQNTLQMFPTEMEAVYERVLRDLTQEQMLHAAIAFYIIEHGLTSFKSSHEISTYDFFITWTTMVESLSDGIEFDSTFDIRQFKIRIEAMLGGLLEFSPSGTVRFVHTTFESYLRRAKTFNAITEESITPVYKDGLAGQTFLYLISAANEHVTVDLDNMDADNVARDYSQPLNPDDLLIHINVNNPAGHFAHRLEFLLTAIGRLGQVLFDSQSQARSVWSVVNSSVFVLHQLLCSHAGCGCNQDFRSNSSIWRDRWCLHFLASHGLFHAFEHGIQVTKHNGPDAQQDMLEVTVDVVRKAQLELEMATSMADISTPKRSSFGLNGHRLIDLLLEGEVINPSHLAICQIINFPEQPQFVHRVRQLPRLTDYQKSISCTWFPYPSSNLLCCWTWCSDPCYNRHEQASRLQSLLEMGFDINAKAYTNGTVLHALFDYQEPVPISSHTRLHHVTWPFSRVKFNLVREAGFDFTSPQADDLLEHARKFQDGLNQRTRWIKLRSEDKEQIRDLDTFIKDVLEPLCKPHFTTIWRIGTPPILDQSPTRGSPRLFPLGRSASRAGQRGRSRGSRDTFIQSYGPFLLTT